MNLWERYWENETDHYAGFSRPTIAVVGAPESGKRSLLNTLWGWEAVADSADSVRSFGLFTLIEIAPEPVDAQDTLYQVEGAALIVYLINGTRDLSQSDFAWISRIRALEVPLLIAASKLDQLPKPVQQSTLKLLETRLSHAVRPLYANSAKQVFGEFVPYLTEAAPQIAVRLAAEVKTLRQTVAHVRYVETRRNRLRH